MRNFWVFLFFLLDLSAPLSLYGLERSPWFGRFAEGIVKLDATAQNVKKLANGHLDHSQKGWDETLTVDLLMRPFFYADLEAECSFWSAPARSLTYQSCAIQGRYQWSDEFVGDLCSSALALNLRNVSGGAIRQVAMPYHAMWGLEGSWALGREWSAASSSLIRLWSFAAVGVGSCGAPWTTLRLAGQWNAQDRQELGLAVEGYWGLGGSKKLASKDFHGWGHYPHQSIDLQIEYSIRFDPWGAIKAMAGYRPWARLYPDNVWYFSLSYDWPFSPL